MPPTLGGKSLVTSRWDTGAGSSLLNGPRPARRARRAPSGRGRRRRQPRARGRRGRGGGPPRRRAPQQRVVVGQRGRQRGHHPRVGPVGRVAEHHQGVAPQVPGLPAGHVPAPVAGEQLVVGRGQQVDDVDLGLRAHVGAGGSPAARSWRRFGGHTSWQSSQPYRRSPRAARSSRGNGPSPAAATPGSGGRRPRRGRRWPRGAAVEAPGAGAAAVGDRRRCGTTGGQRRVGDHRAEHEPAPLPRQEQVGVLAVPAEPGPVGGLAVDQGVVVGQHPRPPAGVLERSGHDGEGRLSGR